MQKFKPIDKFFHQGVPLQKILQNHKKWRVEKGGAKANLSGADLIEADLSGVNLSRANLKMAHLIEADLSKADLSDAILHKADLTRAYMNGISLMEADLSQANLRESNLSNANLSGADLSEANLSGADLTFATLFRTRVFGTNLDGCYFWQTAIEDLEEFEFMTGEGIKLITREDSEPRWVPIEEIKAEIWERQKIPGERPEPPRVFISYAWADQESAEAIDQWLRYKGARVEIDQRNFAPGESLLDEIKRWLRRVGVFVCLYSRHSADRPWPKLEREEFFSIQAKAKSTGKSVPKLIYFCLDKTPLDLKSRMVVPAYKMEFEEACEKLWQGITGSIEAPRTMSLSKYMGKGKAPWKVKR